MSQLKCKIIILPQQTVSETLASNPLIRRKRSRDLFYFTRGIHWNDILDKPFDDFHPFCDCTQQHLYLVSNREPKENDWVINTSQGHHPFKIDNHGVEFLKKTNNKITKKIEATTDKSLKLPLIPTAFIKKYINLNEKIEEVLIETKFTTACTCDSIEKVSSCLYCNSLENCTKRFSDGEAYHEVVKIRPDNTVIISRIKDNFTKKEVEMLCRLAFYGGIEFACDPDDKRKDEEVFDNWFETIDL